MLFNSTIFLLRFLPITLIGFYVVGKRWGHTCALVWLTLASLFFYGWWSWKYLLLLLFSMVFNYSLGLLLAKQAREGRASAALLYVGIGFDLLLLAYFKYTQFFLENINALLGTHLHAKVRALPLGISFFTFQQICYRLDAYRGHRKDESLLHHFTSVSFFPHLIAGPIVLLREIIPQFQDKTIVSFRKNVFVVGLLLLVGGLAKKCLIADPLGQIASPLFQSAKDGTPLGFVDGWRAALSYTMQLYFDFSGYCDMALGLAWMFNIRLPLNFNSPYRAGNIIEFWRRWHITLSRFLRDYLYISLGGNRKGKLRQDVNLFLTMAIGGLWHGAGWTFVAWGALHGVYLIINHAFARFVERLGFVWARTGAWRAFSHVLTFVCVVIGWVLFRSESMRGAGRILSAMWLPSDHIFHRGNAIKDAGDFALIAFAALIAFGLPNLNEMLRSDTPALQDSKMAQLRPLAPSSFWTWQYRTGLALILGACVFFVARGFATLAPSEFLYFQF